jgi:hypothetical protein
MSSSQGSERRLGLLSINGRLVRKYRLTMIGKLSNLGAIPKQLVKAKKENPNGRLSMIRMEEDRE